MTPAKRKELRTAISFIIGLAIAMFLFAMAAEHFIAGPG
jgi:hypothetical protein